MPVNFCGIAAAILVSDSIPAVYLRLQRHFIARDYYASTGRYPGADESSSVLWPVSHRQAWPSRIFPRPRCHTGERIPDTDGKRAAIGGLAAPEGLRDAPRSHVAA